MNKTGIPIYQSPSKFLGIDKNLLFCDYKNMLVNKCINLFVYENSPDTLDTITLELYLITNGNVVVRKKNDKYQVLNGNFAPPCNENYQSTKYIGANPWLKNGSQSYTLELNKDCILFCNSYLDQWFKTRGLIPLIDETATQLTESTITINTLQKNSRLMPIINCDTEQTKKAIDNIMQSLYNGQEYKAVNSNLIDDIKINTLLQDSVISNLITKNIELRQYILANFYHQIGINSNYNLKRERLNTAEIETNDDCLTFNIDYMLKARQKCVDNFNKLFGENMTVKINDMWVKTDKEQLETTKEKREEETTDNVD